MSAYRCHACKFERMDGEECKPSKCLCKCHQTTARERSAAKSLAEARAILGADWRVPMSFDEEVAAGHFGKMGPRLAKKPEPKS